MYSIKKLHETCHYSRSIARKEKRKTEYLEYYFFNDKNPLYLPLISTLQFFEGQSDQGVIQLVIKPFSIFQTSRIVSLS